MTELIQVGGDEAKPSILSFNPLTHPKPWHELTGPQRRAQAGAQIAFYRPMMTGLQNLLGTVAEVKALRPEHGTTIENGKVSVATIGPWITEVSAAIDALVSLNLSSESKAFYNGLKSGLQVLTSLEGTDVKLAYASLRVYRRLIQRMTRNTLKAYNSKLSGARFWSNQPHKVIELIAIGGEYDFRAIKRVRAELEKLETALRNQRTIEKDRKARRAASWEIEKGRREKAATTT